MESDRFPGLEKILWMVEKSKSPLENGGEHPSIYRVSTILSVMQEFATTHRSLVHPPPFSRTSSWHHGCAPGALDGSRGSGGQLCGLAGVLCVFFLVDAYGMFTWMFVISLASLRNFWPVSHS